MAGVLCLSMQLRLRFHSLLLAGLFGGALAASAASYSPTNSTFSGMFFETNGVWQQSSGCLTLTTTARARYTARLQVGTERFSFSGQLDGNGSATRQILRRYEEPLTVQFQVDPEDPDLLVGSVSTIDWFAPLFADRAVFDGRLKSTTDVGQYTMVIAGDPSSSTTPGGTSYGTITITKAGALRFAGVLADGAKVTQATRVSKYGQWPFYMPLYSGQGSLYGWTQFNGATNDDLSGVVAWIRPEMSWTWFYPAGFAINADVRGSGYVRPPAGTKVMDLSSAQFEFNGGELDRGFTNSVVLDAHNRIVNLSANRLSVSLSPSSGLFSGHVMDPITWDWIPFKGVVLQRYNEGAGFFPGWSQTGEVWFEGD
jgi:hypothetical protein